MVGTMVARVQVAVRSIHTGCKREPSIEEKERERDALQSSGRDFYLEARTYRASL